MKINKYYDFLSESLNIFINEALVLYTPYFKDAVNELRKSEDESVSKVANFVLGVNNRDIDKLVYNYIGVSKQVDKVSFVPSNKIELNELVILKPTYIVCYYNMEILKMAGIDSLKNIIHNLMDRDPLGVYNDDSRNYYKCQYYKSDDTSDLEKIDIKNSWTKLDEFTNLPGFTTFTFTLLQSTEKPELKTLIYSKNNDLIDDPSIAIKHSDPDVKPSDIKVGRFVNKLIELYFKTNKVFKITQGHQDIEYDVKDFTASDVEKFVNAYTSMIMYENNLGEQFEVVTGDAIKFWYNIDNYESKTGQLGSSCMRYYSCQGFFKIYINNPDTCKLLILKSFNGKLVGRALLWTATDGKTYIDRVYTVKDNLNNIFSRYANDKGYLDVYNLSYELEVQVNPGDYEKYPYMDSLRWYLPETGILSNKRPSEENKPYFLLQETDGDYNTYR